ncbi:acyltransferase family protein [Psychromonas sp. MME2]|uniref:acyltransferase family protein n=1 Tax=unclassified Psychromonas TaxID=2614957 RepID=UPI00339CAFC1
MDIKFTEQHSLFITYSKALAMITVVIGHYNWMPLDIYDPYIYHMPIFFIIGGIVMKPIRDVKKWLKDCVTKYILYMAIWYMVIGLVTWVINHIFATKIVLRFSDSGQFNPLEFALQSNMHNNSLFMVAWFLVAFFLISSLFKMQITLMLSYLQPRFVPLLCLVMGLLVGYVAIAEVAPLFDVKKYWPNPKEYWLINFVCQLGVAYMYLAIGYVIQNNLKIFASFNIFIISVLLMFTFVGNDSFHRLGMSWSQYPDGFSIHLVSALLGCFSLFSVAYFLSVSVNNRALKAIGLHSKDIMTMHMLAFVIIDLFMVQLGYYEYDKILALVHYKSASMWAIYICFGLFMPIAVRYFISQLQKTMLVKI